MSVAVRPLKPGLFGSAVLHGQGRDQDAWARKQQKVLSRVPGGIGRVVVVMVVVVIVMVVVGARTGATKTSESTLRVCPAINEGGRARLATTRRVRIPYTDKSSINHDRSDRKKRGKSREIITAPHSESKPAIS